MPKLNGFFGFRCTKIEQLSLDDASAKKGGRRVYVMELHNNAGYIDKKALANLFKSIFEQHLAKRLIKKYCGDYYV